MNRIILIIIILGISINLEAVIRDPDPILSGAILEEMLESKDAGKRDKGSYQLVGLSKEYRHIMVKALSSSYEEVQRAAIQALAKIGDCDSKAILEAFFNKPIENKRVLITVIEALSDLGVSDSITLMEAKMEEESDEHIKECMLRSINRIDNPHVDYPLFENNAYINLKINFLIDDIDYIEYTERDADYNKRLKIINATYHIDICNLFVESKVVESKGFILRESFVIMLNDGRSGSFFIQDDKIYYMNTTHYSQVLYFSAKNEKLVDYIRSVSK